MLVHFLVINIVILRCVIEDIKMNLSVKKWLIIGVVSGVRFTEESL